MFDETSWPYFEDMENIEWISDEQPLTHVQVSFQCFDEPILYEKIVLGSIPKRLPKFQFTLSGIITLESLG